MLIPSFKIKLDDPVLQGLATVGKYDGKHPTLTCATSGGKVFMHSPHMTEGSSRETEVRYLNINKRITALVAGPLDPMLGRDVLLVGTQTALSAYDDQANADLFFREVPEGVSAMLLGTMNKLDAPMALVGGNGTIQGFDAEGEETFGTVTSDEVTAMAFCDVDGDGNAELLVGSADYEIRVFQKEDVLSETTEADRVVALVDVFRTRYGYGLANGTIGVYDTTTRVWRVKSKVPPNALAGFDLDGDGIPELLGGWANGKLEARNERTGDVVYRDVFAAPLAAILKADYRNDGRANVICVAVDGEVRGYLPVDSETRASGPGTAAALAAEAEQAERTMAELNARKQELMYELAMYESNKTLAGVTASAGAVTRDTKVDYALMATIGPPHMMELVLTTNDESVIKAVVAFAENMFPTEGMLIHPRVPTQEARLPLNPPRDTATTLIVKAVVGGRGGDTFHVFELTVPWAKFGMYAVAPRGTNLGPEPTGTVTVTLTERLSRLKLWADAAFPGWAAANRDPDALDVALACLRTDRQLKLRVPPGGGCLIVRADDMDLAAEVIQDAAAFLGVHDLESVAEFPAAVESFRGVLTRVETHNASRLRMAAESADASNAVKALVIKAEDARLQGDMAAMKEMYAGLQRLNAGLVAEHVKRAANHGELLAALKDVNVMIQRAARLRVGAAKARVITQCREAVRTNNVHQLLSIIRNGDAGV